MGVPFLDLRAQYESLRPVLDRAVSEVVESQRFVLGPVVDAFEAELAASLGVRHVVGCNSGTDALLLTLKALDLEPGADVVVPTFTFFATAGAVWNAGLRPVFADIDGATYNVTAETVERALTERTRAIIVVHLFGRMAPMAPLLELAAARGLAVIEDTAQAFGARQLVGGRWRTAGTLGVAGCFSFFPSKVLGGFGDGGAVATHDTSLAERVRKLRVHGGERLYHHEMVGTNSRLDAIQAAVLRAKLPHVGAWIERRREVARAYDEAFADLEGVRTPVVSSEEEPVYNVYTIATEERDALRSALDAAGIGSAVYYPTPLHLQPCFASLGYRAGDLPASERAAREVLSLPIYPELTPAQIAEVSAAVRAFHERRRTRQPG